MLNSFARWHYMRNGIVFVSLIVASLLAPAATGRYFMSPVVSTDLKDDSIVGGTLAPPLSLQLLFINVSAVQISWDYPTADDPLPITFLVQVSHDGQAYENISSLISVTIFIYNHMLFGAYYQFQVLAVFGGVASDPAVSDYFINGVTAPPGPPGGIQAVIMAPWELSLNWEVPATPTPPVYIIIWGKDPDMLDKRMQVYQTTHAEIRNLEPESRVFFRMRTDISGRWSILSDWVNVTMPPPYVMAPIITNHTLSSKCVWLEWKLPPGRLFFNYQVAAFTVCYGNANTSGSDKANATRRLGSPSSENSTCPPDLEPPCQCKEYGPAVSSSNITGLSSETMYAIFLMYSTTLPNLSSLWSHQLLVTTLQGARLVCGSCLPLSDSQLLLDWSVSGGVSITSMRVESCNGSGTSNLASVSEIFKPPLPSSAGVMTLSGLHPWTSYSIAIVSDDISPPGQRACCPGDSCSTLEAAPSAAPSSVVVRNISSQSITLMVAPPPPGALNGRLLGYVIEVVCFEGDEEEAVDELTDSRKVWQEAGRKGPPCMDQEMFRYKNKTTLDLFVVQVDGLLPSSSYHLQVAAMTMAGMGPYSSNTVETKRDVHELASQLELLVIQDTSLDTNFFNSSGFCILSVLRVQWEPPFSYEKDDKNALHNVTFQNIGIKRLLPKFCLISNGSQPSCMYLDGEDFITHHTLNYSLSDIDNSILSMLISTNWSGVIWAWLDLEMDLLNKTTLHVTTLKVEIMAQVLCPSDSDQDQAISIKTVMMATFLLLIFIVGLVTIICTASFCIYKECKRKRNGSLADRSPLAIWNNYIPLRAGDGQSSRSSSEQSLVTVSTGVTSCATSTVTAEPDNDSDVSSISLLHLTSSRSEDDCNAIVCSIPEMGYRSSPDGHSVSSDSAESRNCLVDI